MHDLRSFLAFLDNQGLLTRITRKVNPVFEMPAVMAELDKQGRAYRFDNIEGSEMPLVGGFLNTFERFGHLFGSTRPELFSHREFKDQLKSGLANMQPVRLVAARPVQAEVYTGADVDLGILPVPTFFELDTGPFITGGIGIARDLENGHQNVGIYRTLILDDKRCVISASVLSDLYKIFAQYRDAGEPMPIAMAIGSRPVLQTAAAIKLPSDQSELELAGGLQGAPIEVIKCETSDLLVPANAEIIIEGMLDFSDEQGNVHGEFAEQYGPEHAPVTRVTAITHRRNPLFYATMAGRHPEHGKLGRASMYGIQDALAKALEEQIPDVKKAFFYFEARLGAHGHVALSIDKTDQDQPRRVIEAAMALNAGSFPVSKIATRLVVVAPDIDVEDWGDVEWAIWTRVADQSKFFLFPDVETWHLDRAAKSGKSLRVGIDATMDLEDR